MEVFNLILIFGTSFLITLWSTPRYIRKLTKAGHVVSDVYKKGEVHVPTMGGLAIIGGVLTSLVLSVFLVENVESLLIFYFVVFTYAMFGLLDDLIDVGRFLKIIAPFFMALPIALLNVDTSLWLGFADIELGIYYTFILAPLYVMAVANLVNMHSGYNGLQSGTSLLLLFFITIKAIERSHSIETILYIMPIFGALLAYYYYNKFPSRIFEGNIGALAIGSAIGGYIVLLNNLQVYGIILLIPHIINFMMYAYWRIRRKPKAKFGKIREDGTLQVPNLLTLKWVPAFYFNINEKQATFIMYGVTTIFGIIGFVIV